MDLDLEWNHYLIIAGLWIFILVLLWKSPYGFSGIKEKIIMTVFSLPIITVIVAWQKDR